MSYVFIVIVPKIYKKWEYLPKQLIKEAIRDYEFCVESENVFYDNDLYKYNDEQLLNFAKAWSELVNGCLDSSEYGEFDDMDFKNKSPIFYAISNLLYSLHLVTNRFYIGNSEYDMILNILGDDLHSKDSKIIMIDEIFK